MSMRPSGQIMFRAEMTEEAVPFLERGAYLHPEDPRLPYLLTFAMAKLGKFAEAVVWFETTVELASQSQPDMLNAFFYYRYGASVEQAGDIERASNLFRTSMELIAKMDSDEEETMELRALVYNYLGYMWLENDMNIRRSRRTHQGGAGCRAWFGSDHRQPGLVLFQERRVCQSSGRVEEGGNRWWRNRTASSTITSGRPVSTWERKKRPLNT